MCGCVITTIWPRYEGSVSTSWYPVIEVLKTTSPKRVPGETASPSNTVPSSSRRIPGCGAGAFTAGKGYHGENFIYEENGDAVPALPGHPAPSRNGAPVRRRLRHLSQGRLAHRRQAEVHGRQGPRD